MVAEEVGDRCWQLVGVVEASSGQLKARDQTHWGSGMGRISWAGGTFDWLLWPDPMNRALFYLFKYFDVIQIWNGPKNIFPCSKNFK
jgi:hypothetical protein